MVLLQGPWGGSFQLSPPWRVCVCVCVCRAHSWWPGGTELGVCWCPSEAQLVPPVVPLPQWFLGVLPEVNHGLPAVCVSHPAPMGAGCALRAELSPRCLAQPFPSPPAALGSRSSSHPCKGGSLGSVLWVPFKMFLVLRSEGELGSAGAPRPVLRCHRTLSPPPGLWGHRTGCCACLQRRWRQICQLNFGWCP